jgi:hypothetical protein
MEKRTKHRMRVRINKKRRRIPLTYLIPALLLALLAVVITYLVVAGK